MRGITEQNHKARESLFSKDEKNGIVKFRWWREFEAMLCLSFKRNANNFSETRAEATVNVSAELSEERLRPFGRYFLLHVYFSFLDCTPYSEKGRNLESRNVHLVVFDASNSTVVHCLKKPEMRGSNRQKICANTYASDITAAVSKLVRCDGSISKVRKPQKLDITPAQYNNGNAVLKKDFQSKEKFAIKSIKVISISWRYMRFMKSGLEH